MMAFTPVSVLENMETQLIIVLMRFSSRSAQKKFLFHLKQVALHRHLVISLGDMIHGMRH